MGGACGEGDHVKTIKTIFVAGKNKIIRQESVLDERFRNKGLFYTSYKMAISDQNPMLNVNYFL